MASFDILEEGVPETPHQPNCTFNFPKRSFGKANVVKRSFQHIWFQKWPFCTTRSPPMLFIAIHACGCSMKRRLRLQQKQIKHS